jgi:hypothetical protein
MDHSQRQAVAINWNSIGNAIRAVLILWYHNLKVRRQLSIFFYIPPSQWMKFPARRAVYGDKFLRLKINKRFESHLFHPFVVTESWWIIEERVGSMRFDLSASLSSVGCFYYLLEMAACSLVGAELRRRERLFAGISAGS